MQEKFKKSELWKDIIDEYNKAPNLENLDDFKNGVLNQKIANWEPKIHGMRY